MLNTLSPGSYLHENPLHSSIPKHIISSPWLQKHLLCIVSPVAMDVSTDAAQVESPSLITRATSWASLPVEVRQMILSLMGSPNSGARYDSRGSKKVAPLATVCWEWQVFFEACTFRRLVLDAESLSEFDAIVRRHDARLGYIRKLWLRVQLSKYECPDCDVPEDKATQHR